MTDQTYFGDPEGTRSRAKDMSAAGERLKGAVSRHRGVIEGIEASQPWGTDEPGQKFANGDDNNGYVVSSTGYFEAVAGTGGSSGVGDGIVAIGDAVEATVDQAQGIDTVNANDVGKAGQI